MTTYIPRQLSYADHDDGRVVVPEAALGGQPLPFVVLGDPGMGKSELLRRFAKAEEHTYLTAAQFLRRPLVALPGGVLVLDALDEVSAGKDSDPLERLLARLGEAGWPDFVLSCRAADWRGSTRAQAIAEDYGRKARVLTLAPLTDAQSLALLEAEIGGMRATEFHAALHQHRLAALLANPQSLRMLIDVADGGVPASRADLFDRAARKMLAEHNDRHVRSALNQLDSTMVLDAAGAAMALLLLSGKEGLFNGLQSDTPAPLLHIAAITALPFGQHAASALKCRLFRTTGEADSFRDCHRTVAEYLGARWLGRVVNASVRPRSLVKRLLALIHIGNRVPASLRGLHAWLAYASRHFASPVIAADPYGVLRYGDLGNVNLSAAEWVWDSFAAHGKENPWFRGGDWQTFSVAGLVQQGLGQRLSALLDDPRSSFHLRSLVLDLLREGDCVPEMRETLLAIAADPSRTYSERHDSVGVLAAWPENGVDWSALFLRLCENGDVEAPRLADEAIAKIGIDQFGDADIADIILAGYGGLADDKSHRKSNRSDDYWSLSQSIPPERCASLLDALATTFAPESRIAKIIRYDHGLGHLVWTLIARQIPGPVPDPIRLWRWLDAFGDCHSLEARERAVVASWLTTNTAMRQAVQALIYLTPDGAASRKRRGWHLGNLSTGLYFQNEDVIALLERLVRERRHDAAAHDIFEALVVGWNRQCDWTPAMAQLAELHAAENPALQAIIHPAPVEDLETSALMAKFATRERDHEQRQGARKREDREAVLANREALCSGYGASGPLALCFLGYGEFGGRDGIPAERIGVWVGDDLYPDALIGFEACLHRPIGVSLHDVVRRTLDRDDAYDDIWPVVAGLAQRHLDGRGFLDIGENHVLAALLAKRCALNIVDKHLQGFGTTLEDYVLADAGRFELFLRAMIEPQLNTDTHYMCGTHYLLGGKQHHALRAALLLEWFDAIAGCHATDYEAVINALCDVPDVYKQRAGLCIDRLIDAAPSRAIGEDHTLYWLALRILRDFEGARDALNAAAEAPEFIWPLQKAIGYSRFDSRRIRSMPPDRLAWIFTRFEGKWPDVDRPRGTITGTHHPWDASSFLSAVLFRLADDTSADASRVLHGLVERGSATYDEILRAARAKQRSTAAEAGYTPPDFLAVAAAVREEAPLAAADVKAITLDAIADLQSRIAGGSTDTVNLFYDGEKPKNEERCRNAFLDLLGPTLPFGIVWAPEERMPAGKRADAGFRLGAIRFPLEAKLAWNADLWTACARQLDRLYASADHMAGGHGIYLVFWFGSRNRNLPPPPMTIRPSSGRELEALLGAQLVDDASHRLSIVVFDLEMYSTPS
ncbi:NACHT domain-containing protein [Sphingomonas sp. M6A6_1c]